MPIRVRTRRGAVTRSFAMAAAIAASASGAALVLWFVLDPGGTAATSRPVAPSPAPPEATPEAAPAPPLPDRPVSLFFVDPDAPRLRSAPGSINAVPGSAAQAKLAMEALARGPKDDALLPALPAGTHIVSLFLDEHAEAVVDLSAEAAQPRSVEDELLTVGAIALTLHTNFPEIGRLRLLVEGRESVSLSGHLAIDYPIRCEDPLLLALRGEAPEAPDGAAPPPDAAP